MSFGLSNLPVPEGGIGSAVTAMVQWFSVAACWFLLSLRVTFRERRRGVFTLKKKERKKERGKKE
jgi:hypothetical protein